MTTPDTSTPTRHVPLWGGPHDGAVASIEGVELPSLIVHAGRAYRLVTFDDRLLVYVDEQAIRLDRLLDA